MQSGIQLDLDTHVVGGETWLSGIHLALEPGSFHVLLGRTRAGKTTLLRVLAGLDRPGSGALLVQGQDVTRRDVRQRNVAMVYQQFVNYPSLTVYENIASPLRLRKLPAADIDRRVREVAALLHLEELLERLPAQLSGGQQQRTALARALAKEADLLLLDEPLANLDYKLREELRAELRQLLQRRPTTVVYATSEPAEALQLGGLTHVLHEGRLLQSGPTLQVYHQPATERVGQVFSDPQINLLEATLAEGRLRLSEQVRFPVPPHLGGLAAGSYRLGLRAQHLRLRPGSESAVLLPTVVELEEVSGSETLLHARHGALSLCAHLQGVHLHRSGARVDLFFDPLRLLAFDSQGRLAAAPPHPYGGDSGASLTPALSQGELRGDAWHALS